jgi:hypothetical protein
MLNVGERNMGRAEKRDLHFLREISGYRTTDHKHNEDTGETLVLTDTSGIVTNFQKRRLRRTFKTNAGEPNTDAALSI